MHRISSSFLASFVALATALSAAPAAAQETAQETTRAAGPAVEPSAEATLIPYDQVHAFDREFAVGVYATGHAGSYLAGGIGGRLRFEPFELLGVEVYLEATVVDWEGGGFRHDYPNGFNLYIPIRVDDVRFRPLVGFCDILSFVEPEQDGAPRADDVLIGAHAGFGAEFAVHSMGSLFVDLQVNLYGGHDRSVAGWTGGVGEDLVPFWNVQLNVGGQFHLGRR